MRKGSVFLGGGSLTSDHDQIWSALHRAAGGGTPTIAVICSAADSKEQARSAYYEDDGAFYGYQKLFRFYGFDPVWIPAAVDSYKDVSCDPEAIHHVLASSAVWFNGGDQAKHARCMLQDDGSDTPLMQAVRQVYRRGGTIAGSSAGAAIQGRFTYGEGNSAGYLKRNGLIAKSIADISLCDPDDADNGGFTHGFGFLADIDACVDTHFRERNREGRLGVAVRSLGSRFGIGIDENTAIHIQDGKGVVYGKNRVLIAPHSLLAETPGNSVHGFSLASRCVFDFTTAQGRTEEGASVQPVWLEA